MHLVIDRELYEQALDFEAAREEGELSDLPEDFPVHPPPGLIVRLWEWCDGGYLPWVRDRAVDEEMEHPAPGGWGLGPPTRADVYEVLFGPADREQDEPEVFEVWLSPPSDPHAAGLPTYPDDVAPPSSPPRFRCAVAVRALFEEPPPRRGRNRRVRW